MTVNEQIQVRKEQIDKTIREAADSITLPSPSPIQLGESWSLSVPNGQNHHHLSQGNINNNDPGNDGDDDNDDDDENNK